MTFAAGALIGNVLLAVGTVGVGTALRGVGAASRASEYLGKVGQALNDIAEVLRKKRVEVPAAGGANSGGRLFDLPPLERGRLSELDERLLPGGR